MSGEKQAMHKRSAEIAFCGMFAALTIALMLLGGVIPLATYLVPMLCGLLLLPVMMEFGQRAALTTFLAAALLSLLLGFDKEAAFFYLLAGGYPLVKWRMDRIHPPVLRLGAKLLFFLGALAVLYGALALLFPMEAVFTEFREMGALLALLFALVYILSMLLYDRLLLPLSLIYVNRVKPRLSFLRR